MTEAERRAFIEQEVWRIAQKHREALFEDLDRLDKGRISDATATDITQALKAGGYDEEAADYEEWLSEGLANEKRTNE